MDEVKSERAPRRAWWVAAAVVAAVSMAAAGVWFATDSADSPVPERSEAPSESAPADNVRESACGATSGPPESGGVAIRDEVVEVTDGELRFGFDVFNDSELVAVDVGLSLRFSIDDEDVTDQLGAEHVAHSFDIVDPDFIRPHSEAVDAPSEWAESAVELEVSVDEIGQWCVPLTLADLCGDVVDPPQDGEVSTSGEYVEFNSDGDMAFGFEVHNSTHVAAVDVGLTARFLIDGEDVTDELGEDYFAEWDEIVAEVAPDERDVHNDVVDAPPGWADVEEVELEMTVDDVDTWCVVDDE